MKRNETGSFLEMWWTSSVSYRVKLSQKNKNRVLSNELDQLTLKMYDMRQKLFFVKEVNNDLEKLAVKFDKQEPNSAQLLAYEYSRVCEPLISILTSIDEDMRNVEKRIDTLSEEV